MVCMKSEMVLEKAQRGGDVRICRSLSERSLLMTWNSFSAGLGHCLCCSRLAHFCFFLFVHINLGMLHVQSARKSTVSILHLRNKLARYFKAI